jgi:hypothetical protein
VRTHPIPASRLLPALGVVLALIGPSGARPAQARTAADSLAAILPSAAVTVEILTPDYTRRVEELAVKMNAAARANPQWFQAYMREYGGNAPWHPNFGLTPVEYKEYVSSARSSKWKVRERATLRFERVAGRRRWALHGWGVLTPFEGLVIDLDSQRVESRKGPLPFVGIAAPQTDPGSLGWLWFGTWKASHRVGDPLVGGQSLDVSFHLGPLAGGRQGAIYWTSRRVNRGVQLADEFMLVRFPLPA